MPKNLRAIGAARSGWLTIPCVLEAVEGIVMIGVAFAVFDPFPGGILMPDGFAIALPICAADEAYSVLVAELGGGGERDGRHQ